MSSCGANCGCGSGCQCGSGCGGCSMYSGLGEEEKSTTTQTVITGFAGAHSKREVEEAGTVSENGGCKCGSNCTCDPCNCK